LNFPPWNNRLWHHVHDSKFCGGDGYCLTEFWSSKTSSVPPFTSLVVSYFTTHSFLWLDYSFDLLLTSVYCQWKRQPGMYMSLVKWHRRSSHDTSSDRILSHTAAVNFSTDFVPPKAGVLSLRRGRISPSIPLSPPIGYRKLFIFGNRPGIISSWGHNIYWGVKLMVKGEDSF